MSRNKINQIKLVFLLLILGLPGIFSFNSCTVGDGVGVDSSGNFDGTDQAQCGHALADRNDPEQSACFICNPRNPDHPCYCDTANPDHYLNPDSSCFCNPMIPGGWCYSPCMVPDTSCIDASLLCVQDTCCDPTLKVAGGCYPCSAEELVDVADEVCYPCDKPEDKVNEEAWCHDPMKCSIDFSTDVQAIFDRTCISCHWKGSTYWSQTGGSLKGLSLRSDQDPYSLLVNVTTWADSTVFPYWRVLPYAPESSYLYTNLLGPPSPEKDPTGTHTIMPQADDPLPAEEKEVIRQWIEEGAFESLQACQESMP